MDKFMDEQLFSQTLHFRAKASRSGSWRSPARGSPSGSFHNTSRAFAHFRVPLRMSNDRNHSMGNEPEQGAFGHIGDPVRREFNEQIFPPISNRHQSLLFQRAQEIFAQMNIGAGKDSQFGVWSLEFRVRSLQFVVRGADCGMMRERISNS